MADSSHLLHPEAIHHLPPFITAPGETDVLFVAMAVFVLLAIVGLGVFYFKLHALPEQLAHRGQKIQFQLVAVLGLLALFTHNHAFWIAGLLLALVPLPDFATPLGMIARSLERLADAAQPPTAPTPGTDAQPKPVGTSARAVDGTDSRLRLLPGYRKRLRAPVIAAIDHRRLCPSARIWSARPRAICNEATGPGLSSWMLRYIVCRGTTMCRQRLARDVQPPDSA